MRESGAKSAPAPDTLPVYPPIVAVGSKNLYLFAYESLDEAVEKLNKDFLAGHYYNLHGAFDQNRFVNELRFFDSAGQELEPEWDSQAEPSYDMDSGHRVRTLQVKGNEAYVRSRFQSMLHEVGPRIDEARKKGLVIPDVLLRWLKEPPDEGVDFAEVCRALVKVLSDAYPGYVDGGFVHRLLGGD
jgi:hypothetical protein